MSRYDVVPLEPKKFTSPTDKDSSMLVYALDQNGEPIAISDAPRGKRYWCIHCLNKEKRHLTARKGKQRQHSFAHDTETEHRKESVSHFESKRFAIDLLAQNNIEARDEVKVSDSRADVLLNFGRQFALEIQYSTQTSEKYSLRNLKYEDVDVRCHGGGGLLLVCCACVG